MHRVPVSAVIAVRNGASFIGEALRSIFDQTWTPREVIVIDDGSTDETCAEVHRFPEVIYAQQLSLGQAAARNHGASLASMPYLAFLDADDIWVSTKIELQLGVLLENPGLDLVSGQMVQFTGSVADGMTVVSSPAAANLPGLMLIRRNAFQRVGPYSSEVLVGEVVDWWARAIDLGMSALTLDAVVLMRRIHDRNLGRTVADPMRDYLRILRTVVKRRRARGQPNS
jgi:glycosyltransferase involved in cell wall biosynthesis